MCIVFRTYGTESILLFVLPTFDPDGVTNKYIMRMMRHRRKK
jgi:hypothetical protein